jgi:protein involved in polysaccharide export with SLBB domain
MFESFVLPVARRIARAGLLLGLIATALPDAVLAQGAAAGPSDVIRLSPGYVVRLEGRDEPRLACECVIDRDGQILVPLIGLVTVAGRPFDDVRRELLSGFDREIVDAEIRLIPLLRIPVLGEVMRPGLVLSDPTFTLAEVLASAGGLSPSANRNAISLMRRGEAVSTMSIDEVAGTRVPLLSGDQVFVARRSWMQENTPILVSGGVSVVAALITALLLR